MAMASSTRSGGMNSGRPENDNIRASCDNCANSKVRCSRDQPRCRRCVYQGVTCVYSPSQRVRKRRPNCQRTSSQRQREQPSGIPSTESSETTAMRVGDPQNTTFRPRDSAATGDMDCGDHADVFNLDNPSVDIDTADFTDPSLFSADGDGLLRWSKEVVQHNGHERLPSQPATLPFVNLGLGLMQPENVQPHLQQPQQQQQQQRHDPCESLHLAGPWTPPYHEKGISDPHENPYRSQTGSNAQNDHQQCSALALSMLQTLDMPNLSCASLPSPSKFGVPAPQPSNSTSTGTGSRSFYTVLNDNSKVLARIRSIFKCSCNTNTSLTLLIATLCLQVLSWHEAVLDRIVSNKYNRRNANRNHSNGNENNSRSGGSILTPPSTVCFGGLSQWVFIPTINIGAYTLDEDHTEVMVAQLILAQLVQIRGIMDLFSESTRSEPTSRPASLSPADAPHPNEENRNLFHQALEPLLRDRLRTVLLAAREQLQQG